MTTPINRYPLWKYLFLAILIVVGCLYALPNMYGDDPAVQISANNKNVQMDAALLNKVSEDLQHAKVKIKRIELNHTNIIVRFFSTDDQLKARDLLSQALWEYGVARDDYIVALNLLAATPRWLRALNAVPMKLGLDLRGGVHFLLEVDVNSVIKRRLTGMLKSFGETLRQENIRYTALKPITPHGVQVEFSTTEARQAAYQTALTQHDFRELQWTKKTIPHGYALDGMLTPSLIRRIQQDTVEQTMTTLRNRVNELGVAEAVVQQQGANRISVDLPGIQDSARAKQILGGTATLEFHLVADANARAAVTGVVPLGMRLYSYQGQPILLHNQVILSGDSISSARTALGEDGKPVVSISLSGGEGLFSRVTRRNIGKRLGIVFIETKTETQIINGKTVKTRRKAERLISAPVIRETLGTRFQITGLEDMQEARTLALLLRAGALPAAIDPVEERLVGPSLGKENIKRGLESLVIGMAIIIIFMALYYGVFGVIADLALLLNLILISAVLSVLGATLTLPGIAGIVLTVGMAVDANVLIFERIREELRAGLSVQAAIHAGYERAFSTIVDANVTTLIVAIVLFSIGSGPIKGFAVTLTIGLLTSMLTAITFTRAIVNWRFGGRTLKRLPIGL